MTWDGLKTDPENGVVINLNTAYLDAKGEYDIHTIHTSYLIPNVLKMKNFNIYLGAYASWVNASPKAGDKKNDDRYGGRVRFKYSL
ncbi:carbohydrate porin [Enterobacter bugandensis]|uniref:carbohydrate porin n=1 Tax=Enterobacter bugandensis TaxID=881260 RepID=UPI003F4365C2